MGVDSTPNATFPLIQALPSELPEPIRAFQNQVDVAIGPSGVVGLRELDSANILIPSITVADVGSHIYNIDTTPNNIAAQAFGNENGYQAIIGAVNLGPAETDGADLFFATRAAGEAAPLERMRILAAGNLLVGPLTGYYPLSGAMINGRCVNPIDVGIGAQGLAEDSGTANIWGFSGAVSFLGPGTRAWSQAIEGHWEHNGAGTTTEAIAIFATARIAQGTVTRGSGLYVQAPWITGGTIDRFAGLYIEDIVGSTANYAIYTNAGDVKLGGNTSVGNLQLSGTPGDANKPIFVFNTGQTTAGITGTLWGILQSTFAWQAQMDTSGNFGVRGSLNATTGGTFGALVTITSTTEQLRLRYDASNYASFTVSSAGLLTFGPNGVTDTVRVSTLGNVGIAMAPHGNTERPLSVGRTQDSSTEIAVQNLSSTGVSAGALFRASADVAQIQFASWSSVRNAARFGLANLNSWNEVIAVAGNGIIFGAYNSAPIIFGTNALGRMRIEAGGNIGINTTTPRKQTDILSASQAQLRLSYSDNAVYTEFLTDSAGLLTISPTSGSVMIAGGTASLFLKDTSTGFQASATTVINPAANNAIRSTSYTSGLLGWNISALGNAEFNNVDVRGAIHASIFTYNAINVTAGTQLVTPSGAKLKSDVVISAGPTYGTTAFTIDVVDQEGLSHAASQLFAVNDILRLKDGLVGDTWFKVTAVSDQATFWRYTASIQAGTANVTYRAGMGVPDYGVSGKGGIMLTADQANAPYLQMFTHAGAFSSADASGTLVITPQLRLGNLNGSYGYASDIYGLGAGQYGAASKEWITVDQTNGIRIGNNTTVVAQWATSGAITIGQVAAGQDNILISSGALQLRNNTTVWVELGSTGVITVGQVAASQSNILISSGALQFRNNTTVWMELGSTGVIIIGQVAAAQANTLISSGALSMRINTTPYFSIATSGDVTLGNVATDQGNAFWNNTNKKLEFRGSTNGTVVQAYVDTTGAIMAGAGSVILNSSGILLIAGSAAANQVKWYDSSNLTTAIGQHYTSSSGGAVTTTIYTKQLSGVSTGFVMTGIRNLSDLSESAFWLVKYDNSHATLAGVGFASLGVSNGFLISSFVSPTQPTASTILECQSTTGAFLPPKMTTTQRDALTATDGMILYNTTTGALNYRKAGAWVAI